MSKLRVAVLYGGPSKEHDISVSTGEAMIKALGPSHYDVIPVYISREGEWVIDEEHLPQTKALPKLKEAADFALIGLHGTFGEDGKVQELLESASMAYSGSGSHSSKLAMDKHTTSMLFRDAGFSIPKEKVVTRGNNKTASELLNEIGLPAIVKPDEQGSSVGVSKVISEDQLLPAIELALVESETALVQEYISGVEVSCSVYENEIRQLKALPPTELIPLKSDFFDYDAKYTIGSSDEITPPNISKELIEEVQMLAISAHKVVSCSGYSRTDIIIKGDELYILEINTLPGLTEASIMPKQAKAAGMTLTQILDLIIQAGLRKGV